MGKETMTKSERAKKEGKGASSSANPPAGHIQGDYIFVTGDGGAIDGAGGEGADPDWRLEVA